ncbi:MAG: serine/threonine-protein kinase [Thermoleophilia bacterium]
MILHNRPGRLILDRYELLEQIGRGGFSTVYRAHDQKMGREVAVKAVRRTDELTDRASREARAAAMLSHPHIVTVFELAEDDSEVYLVSELVRGQSLKESIDTGSLSDYDCLVVARQVLAALEHAHDQGVVHRDIKPDNIMLADDTRQPVAKVMDFGIAQLENTQRITRRGDVVGTIAYMSPEQADGQRVDSATDVYSTALTLYECLTGSNPFRAGTAAEIIGKIQIGALPLTHVRPDLPRELSQLVVAAMEPDPRLRLDLRGFAAGLDQVTGLAPGEQATTVLRRDGAQRRTFSEKMLRRFGFVATRSANAGLAAIVMAAATGSGFYPETWSLPLILGGGLAVGLLPRIGLLALAVVSVVPVVAWSTAAGAILAAVLAIYFLSVGLLWPRVALLPVLAVGLGFLGLGLAFPAVAGAVGRLRRGLLLALVGSACLTLFQLLSNAGVLDYLGIANSFGLRAALAGQYNPLSALETLSEPFRRQPVLLAQPIIWLAAALPAAMLIKRRRLSVDLAGLLLANVLLTVGYLSLPYAFPAFSLSPAAFLKSLSLCVIIQVVLLLASPRNRLQSIPPS